MQDWVRKGYDHDPRAEVASIIRKAEFEDVMSFYNRLVKNRPVILMMSGNMKKMDKHAVDRKSVV